MKVQILLASLAVGMIGLPQHLDRQLRHDLREAVFGMLDQRFPNAALRESVSHYERLWHTEYNPAGNPQELGTGILRAVLDPSALPEPHTVDVVGQLVGGECLLVTAGLWSGILNSYTLVT
jgi:hypothetical protein